MQLYKGRVRVRSILYDNRFDIKGRTGLVSEKN